ncbi:hypothetical protein SCALM49S_06645 [Streptomyces californicus]
MSAAGHRRPLVRAGDRDDGGVHGPGGRHHRQHRDPLDPEGDGGAGRRIQWITAGYALAFAAGLITGGRLGDIYGRKRVFRVGIGGFTLASALCGLAAGPEMLVAARILQGARRR